MKNIKLYITEKLKIKKHLSGHDIKTFEDIIKKLYDIGLFKKHYDIKDFSKISLKITLYSTFDINYISIDNILELVENYNLDSLFEIENKKDIREYRIKQLDNPNEFIILHYNRKTLDIEGITVSENIMKFIIDICK